MNARATRFRTYALLLFVAMAFVSGVLVSPAEIAAQKKPADGKSAKNKKQSEPLDPTGRPEGPLAAKLGVKSARYFVWYDKQGWHLRTTAGGTRRFHGTMKVTDGTIASCISVGLKGDGKKSQDAWRVGPQRKVLEFDFRTSTASDGLDIRIDGDDAELEFNLLIDGQAKAASHLSRQEAAKPARAAAQAKSCSGTDRRQGQVAFEANSGGRLLKRLIAPLRMPRGTLTSVAQPENSYGAA